MAPRPVGAKAMPSCSVISVLLTHLLKDGVLKTHCRGCGGYTPNNPHYVYWSSIDKGNIYMANIAAFMTGAKLYEHTSDATSKTELVDRLLNAMRKLNSDTTRAAASGLANGKTKLYYVILRYGEDAVFKPKFSVRSFRNKTKQACFGLIEQIKGLGDSNMDLFLIGCPRAIH